MKKRKSKKSDTIILVDENNVGHKIKIAGIKRTSFGSLNIKRK